MALLPFCVLTSRPLHFAIDCLPLPPSLASYTHIPTDLHRDTLPSITRSCTRRNDHFGHGPLFFFFFDSIKVRLGVHDPSM
jgi:hypothetical protein